MDPGDDRTPGIAARDREVVENYRDNARARVRSLRSRPMRELDMNDPRHLLLVGTGPGLGTAIAHPTRPGTN
jgi:hypothetical protein